MRHLVGGPWVIGRLRAALLVAVALAAVADLTTYVVLVSTDGDGRETAAAPGPDVVARTVVQAVADADCADLDGLLAEEVSSPSLAACLRGVATPVDLSALEVVGSDTDGDAAAVTVELATAGQRSAVVVDLRRVAGRWVVTSIRPQR